MALVFHELATNAVKYGALSSDRGRVDITWTFEEADERLSLRWAETDGPPVAAPTRVGFGSRLIERGLQGDLRGSATLSYDPGGVTCAMEARLPRTAAPKPTSS
jgi:two-component sensor histidine kinase